MEILEQLGLALGLASLAGVNLYLTVLLSGVLVHFNLLHLADKYQDLAALGHPWVIAVAGALFLVEFFADKVPWVDSLWDSVARSFGRSVARCWRCRRWARCRRMCRWWRACWRAVQR